jgi:outer membrane receptor protein involved in Fe transport
VGVDAYYKLATDMIDDGQFGPAVVLTQFNWASGYSEGVELKAKYHNGNFKAYADFAYNITRVVDPVSNQYLLYADEYPFLLNDSHHTDDMQPMTGSASMSYRWNNTLFTTDFIYGSGLRSGLANMDHSVPSASINFGVSQELPSAPGAKPLTVRFDIVNLFDQIYEPRDGSGIGVFAPQFGGAPRLFFRREAVRS